MNDEPTGPPFAADQYRGAAEAYAEFRLGYPEPMTEHLLRRVEPSGRGRLLDLACGTGQLSFALGAAFAEIWAVDREPDMIRVLESRATTFSGRLRAVVSDAEDLDAPDGGFQLIAIGNAFHRLDRRRVAGELWRWLQPAGHVALCWSDAPWAGPASWQRLLADRLRHWRELVGAASRAPAGWDVAGRQPPDGQVMADAGFVGLGRSTFTVEHRWTVPELVGFVRSTSLLPATVLGERTAALAGDLADTLAPYCRNGELSQLVSFAYDLFRRP